MGVVCKATCFRPKRLRPTPPVLLYFFSFLSFSARRFVLRACAQRNAGFNFFCLPTISPTLSVSHSLPQQIVEGDSIVCLALLPLAVTHVTACLTLLAPGCFSDTFPDSFQILPPYQAEKQDAPIFSSRCRNNARSSQLPRDTAKPSEQRRGRK
jgi:hypothetical protein